MQVKSPGGISFVAAWLLALGSFSAHAAEPWEADRIFMLDMSWQDRRAALPKVSEIDAQTSTGIVAGTVMSTQTFAVLATPWDQPAKNLPTGASDQAVAWPAAGCVDPTQGSVSLFVQGKAWNVADPQRETLVVLDGKAGSLSIEKNKPNTLAIVLNGAALIETSLTNADNSHHVVATFESAQKKKPAAMSLYLDGRLVGRKEGVALPTRYERLVVGQLGPGPGTDKVLENVSVYRRPLTSGEIGKIGYLEGRSATPKLATVPFTAKPPTIDGIFSPGEWDGAAGVCGFMDWVSGKPWTVEDTIRLQYDNERLYFAYHCPPPPQIKGNAPMIAAMLKNTRTAYDSDVEADDALWVSVHKPFPAGDVYNMVVNGVNTHYDFSLGGTAPGSLEKNINLNWNPQWITRSTLTMDGWRVEGSVPWKDVRMEPPKPGQDLYVNFMRFWRSTLSGPVKWAYVQRDALCGWNRLSAAPIRFGAPGGVAVQLDRIGNMIQGTLDVHATLVNAGPQPVKLRVALTTNSRDIDETKDVEVPANGSVPYEFTGRVIKPETAEVVFRVTEAVGGAVVFVSSHPVFRADHPSVNLRKYPSWNLVKFETEFDSLSETPARDLSAEMTVVPAAGGKMVAKAKAAGFEQYRHTFELSTKTLPAGKYVAEFRFSQKRRVLDTVRLEFEVKPLPAWYNNTIGYDDPQRPVYPFARMELRANSEVCVWGRIYRWGDSLLPIQIEVNPETQPLMLTGSGRGMLRKPMQLAGQVDGAAFSTEQLKAAFEWPETLPTRIVGKRTVTIGNLSITADVRSEYDGFCWVKLTLAPVKGTVEVQSLAFEEAFTPEFSDVVNAGEYSLVGTGKFPDQLFQKSALLPIWVGNGDGGLQTFLESMATWHVKDAQTTMQLAPGKDGGTMRYNLVDKPLVLSKPRVIEFGWNATPTRVKEWRTFREPSRGHRTSYFGWYPGVEWNVGDLGWVNSHFNAGGAWPDAGVGAWNYGQPYVNTDYLPINDPDVQEFGDEWLVNADDRWRDKIGKAGETILVSYHAKSCRDYILWRMNELFTRMPFGGWYYDVVSPQASLNPYANAGVVLDDGSRAPTKSLLGLREVTKRLYTLCRRTYPDGQAMIHSSGMPNMAYMAFCEIFFDGENLNGAINAQQPTYRGVMTPDRFRAEYMGHNFGPKLWWLGQNRVSKEAGRTYGPDVLVDHLSGIMLLHDTPIVFAGGFGCLTFRADGSQITHADNAARRDLDAVRRYDLYGCGYRFVPYWRQDAAAGLKEKQYVSWYVRQPQSIAPWSWRYWTREETDETLPHRAIGIVCNESDWKGEMALTVDLKKLGFADGAKVKAINAVHSTGYRVENADTPEEKGAFFPKPEETATINGNELRFPLTDWNYRMIVIEEEK